MTQPTDVSEQGFESLIVESLVTDGGYLAGSPKDYDRGFALDVTQLRAFLAATQPEALAAAQLDDPKSPTREKFLSRIQAEITKRGVIEVLRKGIKHGPLDVSLYYGVPSPGNLKAAERHAANRFTVTRQVHFSADAAHRSLDLVIFVNGLPVATFELKNRFTNQTLAHAISQYKNDRDPNELIFQRGRCAVHFAVDDTQVAMCAELRGPQSWFLPFNKGFNDGAGNPPNPAGIATDYLWKSVLPRASLADIIENFAQIIEEEGENGKKKRKVVFPRYHQLEVVRRLLADARAKGVGQRYLIQHSAGSGKSNSITWLAHQLIEVRHGTKALFDSILVVTDRRVLDKQLRDNLRRFMHEASAVGAALRSGDLKKFLQEGKKVIVTTVQKFPFVLEEMAEEHNGRRFAIVIDEAHSSQGGKASTAMHVALGDPSAKKTKVKAETGEEAESDESDTEDKVNAIIESRRQLKNGSYFAFTATPKKKTLRLFGEKVSDGPEPEYRPFHTYTMKQAIQEGFILDVLTHYTPVDSYYRLVKTIEDDPAFDVNRAHKKLRKFVEDKPEAIARKAEVMIDHFLERVIAAKKIGGQARAMVVSSGIARAIEYKLAFDTYLAKIKSPFKSIVAFSGEHEVGGKHVDEAAMNGFPSADIPERFKSEPYRFLIVADKYQTGFDEPLLHTMYVDKPLGGPKAVQTLSRLNRAHPKKDDCFVLDFVNDEKTIQESFADYYRTTILSGETDPNKLHDLKAELDAWQVYEQADVETLVALFLGGASREKLDAIVDACVPAYLALDEDGQVGFKGNAKAFVRTYEFLATVLPYGNTGWEKLTIFLNFLLPKLPAPKEEDLAKGILDTIDMETYRIEVRAQLAVKLPDADGILVPDSAGAAGFKKDAEVERLSVIVQRFNELFANIPFEDRDLIARVIAVELPQKVAADPAVQAAIKNSDPQNARIECDKALEQAVLDLLTDHTELFKQFSDNPSFKRFVSDAVFSQTYKAA